MDTVFLNGIHQDIVVGKDAWQRAEKPQPVLITIELSPLDDFQGAAAEDDVALTVDYGKLFKTITKSISTQSFESVRQLVISLVQCMPPFRQLYLEISLPKALLLVDGGLIHTVRITRDDSTNQMQVFHHVDIKQMRCSCIIGVNPHERLNKQRLLVSIGLDHVGNEATLMATAEPGLFADFFECAKQIVERVEASSYQTVESLATAVAQIATMTYGFDAATVRIEKPSAIATINAAGVQITRSKTYFENKDFWKVKRP